MRHKRTLPPLTRRRLLAGGAALAAAGSGLASAPAGAATPVAAAPMTRVIPSTGVAVPAVGLGSWITFNVGNDEQLLAECAAVMAAFFGAGGRVIDSSPMYGSSQATIGHGLTRVEQHGGVFAADKVWTNDDGAAQIATSARRWGVTRFELMQVHNLVDWQRHLPMLREMKEAGWLGHVGITTSHGRRHDDFERVMRTETLDAVQLTYNPVDREAERRLLPLAQDRGLAVIVNRPFRRGSLTRRLEGEPLPGWAAEIGAATWAQAILKFILSHPAVTVAIPATTQPAHAAENVAAAAGPLPDAELRQRIAADIRAV